VLKDLFDDSINFCSLLVSSLDQVSENPTSLGLGGQVVLFKKVSEKSVMAAWAFPP
jgi:hypothetical protein